MRPLAIFSALLFVGTVFAANWAITQYGFVSVGFGLTAPAGVWFAGLALICRDLCQRTGGRRLVVAAIIVGAACSYFVAPAAIATASGVAFLTSEACDMAVYTPIARRHFLAGVASSNVVGAIVDSVIFLGVAFGFGLLTAAAVGGLVLGKLWVTILALPVLWLTRRQTRWLEETA